MPNNIVYCAFNSECNNNCLFCDAYSETQKKASFSLVDICQLLEKLNEMKNAELEISGGEPTLRPERFYFLERISANSPDTKCILMTNGRRFSSPHLAAKLSEHNLYRTRIPIHGDTPQLHDSITRAEGSFNETLLGIRNLYDHNVNVELKTIVNKLNYKRMPQIVDLVAHKFPECSAIRLCGLNMLGGALINKEVIGVKLSDAVPYIERALDTANELGFKAVVYSIPPCILGKEYQKFAIERTHSTILKKARGKLYTMQHCIRASLENANAAAIPQNAIVCSIVILTFMAAMN